MRSSFRARLTVLSVGVSGLVLAVFALSAWALVYRTGLRQIDREMAERVGPILVVSHPREQWLWIVNGLRFSYGGDHGRGCVVLVKGPEGELLERSDDWPEALPVASFPVPRPDDPRLRYAPGTAPPPMPPNGPQGGPASPQAPGPGQPPPWPFLPVTPPEFATKRVEGRTWRLCTMANREATLVLGIGLAELVGETARVRNAFIAALPAALLLIALGSWLLSRRALRSVEDLAHVAEQVTASSLDQRIPPEGVETEFRRLVTVFNEMLDRLERSFNQATRFSADAAHELRTPLTILQGELEQALQHASGEAEQQVLGDLLEEVQRLKDIIRKLLLLSLADSGQLRLTRESVNLSDLVESLREDTEALAPQLTVTADVTPDVSVSADADLLQQALRNLSTNAAKYNRDGGFVAFRLGKSGGQVAFSVSNTGPGIAPPDREHVFDRFFRGDPARGRKVDGVGLGLSLAREIARAHGGDLTLDEPRADLTTFALTLPADPTPGAP